MTATQKRELEIMIPVDPLELRINIRYKNANQFVPESIKKAMAEVTKRVENVRQFVGWEPGPTDMFGVEIDFWFPTRRPDIDGPLKRTLDAAVKGLGFDDNRIDELIIHRWVGEPAIRIKLWTLPANRDPNAKTVKPKTTTPKWVG